jgi:hypothetical protein
MRTSTEVYMHHCHDGTAGLTEIPGMNSQLYLGYSRVRTPSKVNT